MARSGILLLAALALGAPSLAQAQTAGGIRGYVTMIDANSAKGNVTLWIGIDKGVKGNQEATLDPSEPFFLHKFNLARDALRGQHPVKVEVEQQSAAVPCRQR